MNNKCNKENPLIRDGTSQIQRYLKSLDPSYIAVDERSLEDLLMFAKKYAEYVKYHDENTKENSADNWVDFIKNDITTLISIIAKFDIENLKNKYDQNLSAVKNNPNIVDFKLLCGLINEITWGIDKWYKGSIKKLRLHDDLSIIIQSSLSEAVKNFISYDKGAYVLSTGVALNLPYPNFSSIWNVDPAVIITNTEIYGDPNSNDEQKIHSALEYINSVFEVHYNAVANLIKNTPEYLKEALKKYPYHQAHFALFLAFLQIFKYSQKHLNKITGKHLDYYYKDILQLEEKKAIPDQVYLIFELAKNCGNHPVPKDTCLKAGKDSSSIDLFYNTEKEIAVNKAQISSIKTIFIDQGSTYGNIYSSPMANSKDGLGEALDPNDPKWKTFGESQWSKDENVYRAKDKRTMQFAEVGFAIASPQLILNEGIRKITLRIEFEENGNSEIILKGQDKNYFKFYLSGEEEWIQPIVQQVSVNSNLMTCVLNLTEAQPAIVPFDPKGLNDGFNTKFPVLKIVLDTQKNPYENLKNIRIASINIHLDIKKVKNLVLQNDLGLLDPNKPFLPFGPSPTEGSSFYIGSEEIFYKKLESFKLKINWHEVPAGNLGTYYANYSDSRIGITTDIDSNDDFKANIKFLENKDWQPFIAAKTVFDTNDAKIEKIIQCPSLFSERYIDLEKFVNYDNQVNRGFIKLELKYPDFQHKNYPVVVSYIAINEIKELIINPPYTPTIKTLEMDYISSQDFESETEQFFHIYPFGVVETTPVKPLNGADDTTKKNPLIIDSDNLLPQFKIEDVEQKGFLLLGMTGLKPRQNLTILFKMAEGSGDATLPSPDVTWGYMRNNELVKLDNRNILSDSTNGLLTTGIVELDISSDATDKNSALPSGLFWIFASVDKNSAAISQMIDLKTQAVTAVFKDNNNDPNHLKTALVEKTITKLKTKIPEIKSITQPYASFGGKVNEQGSEFYRRVSERLRHKNRSLNIWDYERMVLEKFPSIYKVKCLNHTNFDLEIIPGFVTIIPISNLRNQNAVDPLKPMTSLNIMEKIKEYLSKHISHFIELEVRNPFFEQIKTMFKVKFHTGIDFGIYRNILSNELIKFLSPWAFNEGVDVEFGGKIHASYIINFIEECPYVDYITDFEMFLLIGDINSEGSIDEAVASSAASILGSYREHEIDDLEKSND